MTEAEWLRCDDPGSMLSFLSGRVSDCKLRLFALACCERIGSLITDARSRAALSFAEQHAHEDLTRQKGRIAVQKAAAAAARELGARLTSFTRSDELPARTAATAADAAVAVMRGNPLDAARWASHLAAYSAAWSRAASSGAEPYHDAPYDLRRDEQEMQLPLLRDIFGNLFRPVTADPSWFTSTAATLATGIYAERAFDRLPILADALEDAGCANADILAHCRGGGEHVRGCWVIDLLLGKQ